VLLNRLKKAFTILELLVVIIIIGVVSIVSIPNVRDFLTERETRNTVLAIATITGSLKSEIDSGLSRNPNKIAGDAHGAFMMGYVLFEQYPDQFRMVKRYRSDEQFKTIRNCDPGGQWDSGFFYYGIGHGYPDWKNIVISNSNQQNPGQQTFCLAKDPTLIAASTLTIHVCNSYNNPSRTCGINFKNDPIYRFSIQRLGNTLIEKYNYTNATWNVIQN
jgi:prepilin-type N-terminal cleavage/methylation domain-containing protein